MNPKTQFCPNINCPARGKCGRNNITIHSQKKRRYYCKVCGKAFTETKGTVHYRLQIKAEVLVIVLTLIGHGCPIQAIVHAFGFDERTVMKWVERAGAQCQHIHQYLVTSQTMDLQHIQADEIKVKSWGQSVWMALAIMVETRLWLGGAVAPQRTKQLLKSLLSGVRQMALCRPLLIEVDGLPGYVKVIQQLFRSKIARAHGEIGRPRLYSWPQIAIVQVIKYRLPTFHIDRRLVQGCQELVAQIRCQSQKHSGTANTAYIERLNATFRSRITWLTRRSRALAHRPELLAQAMFLVGTMYNFCDPHQSLRLKIAFGRRQHRWVSRTPAMAAHLTDHIWTVDELLKYKVPPPAWVPPKRQGRPSKATLALINEWIE